MEVDEAVAEQQVVQFARHLFGLSTHRPIGKQKETEEHDRILIRMLDELENIGSKIDDALYGTDSIVLENSRENGREPIMQSTVRASIKDNYFEKNGIIREMVYAAMGNDVDSVLMKTLEEAINQTLNAGIDSGNKVWHEICPDRSEELDTTLEDVEEGQDMQGIPWETTRWTRKDYRQRRDNDYKS